MYLWRVILSCNAFRKMCSRDLSSSCLSRWWQWVAAFGNWNRREMYRLMYRAVEEISFFEGKSIKPRLTRLEQILLPSVFHTEEQTFLKLGKVNASMADHLVSKGQTRSRKLHNHHLMQLGSVFLLQCVVFLARNIERLWCVMGTVGRSFLACDHSRDKHDSFDCVARYQVLWRTDHRW